MSCPIHMSHQMMPQQATVLLTTLLQDQDFFNTERMDEIQILAIGQADLLRLMLGVICWKSERYYSVFYQLSEFLFTKLSRNFRSLSKTISDSNAKSTDIFSGKSHFLEQQNFDWLLALWQDAPFYSDAQEIQNLNQLMYLNYWLSAFSPFSEQNIPLVWQAFQQFPFEIFSMWLFMFQLHI